VILALPWAFLFVFPISVFTGALANLTSAVCGGTPLTNQLYW
jgi:hypothetical protein